jgi:hypothetical protein
VRAPRGGAGATERVPGLSPAARNSRWERLAKAPEAEVLQGSRRAIGVAPNQQGPGFVDTLRALVESMRRDDPGDVRDRALLCRGFARGCRRFEFVDSTRGSSRARRVDGLDAGGRAKPGESDAVSVGGRCALMGASGRPRAACLEGTRGVQRVRGGQHGQQHGGSCCHEREHEPWGGGGGPPPPVLLRCAVAGDHRLGEAWIIPAGQLPSRHGRQRPSRCEFGDAVDRCPGAHAAPPHQGVGREVAGLYIGLNFASRHSPAIVLIDQH